MLISYDIRGKFGTEITIDYASTIGKKFLAYTKAKKIAIGYDNRFSSPILVDALIKNMHCNIILLGLCTSPMLYFAINELKLDGGVMITASHNPIAYNGFKILQGNLPMLESDIQKMLAMDVSIHVAKRKVIKSNINKQYIEDLLQNYHYYRRLKIAWDLGNCTVGTIIDDLIEKLPEHRHILINKQILKYATADPMVDQNLQKIQEIVLRERCDIGFAFDGDGDRLRIIDNQGIALSSNQALIILVQNILKNNPNQVVIIDVKISNKISQLISSFGGVCLISPTGHTFIKHMMRAKNEIMAGDGSGHFFFGKIGYDDALYAAIKFISILSCYNWLSINNGLPKIYSEPEIRMRVNNKIEIILCLKRILKSQNILFDEIDGIRVNEINGWWLVRASNTEEVLSICYEGETQEDLLRIKEKVFSLLDSVEKSRGLIQNN